MSFKTTSEELNGSQYWTRLFMVVLFPLNFWGIPVHGILKSKKLDEPYISRLQWIRKAIIPEHIYLLPVSIICSVVALFILGYTCFVLINLFWTLVVHGKRRAQFMKIF